MKFMKSIINKIIWGGAAIVLFAACEKNLQQAVLTPGSFGSSGLTASATTLVLDTTSGAGAQALALSWPTVNYGAKVTVTYTLQIDSINDNFINPVNVGLASGVSQTYTEAGLNTLALSLGLAPSVAGQLHARVKADVNQSTGTASTVPTVYSNVVNLTITPYSTVIPPLYPVPAALFLVGSATPGGPATGWNNPVPVPTQQFTQIDATTFGMVIQLVGGQQFLLLPVNGDWSHKYAVTSTTPSPTGGPFVPDAANNMNGPVNSGLYEIIVDFVKGTYTITPATAGMIPVNLYIVGDATAGAWNNPVPVPSQQFTQLSNGEFSISIPLLNSGSYLFLPLNGDWTNKYGGASATGGPLLFDSAVPSTNTPCPAAAGTYTIDVNFFSNQYTVK
jgi:starch-binding outer membrane protein SusE/F